MLIKRGHSRCQFLQHFMSSFFCTKMFFEAFLYQQLVSFWQKSIGKWASHKMLIKWTLGLVIFLRQSFFNSKKNKSNSCQKKSPSAPKFARNIYNYLIFHTCIFVVNPLMYWLLKCAHHHLSELTYLYQQYQILAQDTNYVSSLSQSPFLLM